MRENAKLFHQSWPLLVIVKGHCVATLDKVHYYFYIQAAQSMKVFCELSFFLKHHLLQAFVKYSRLLPELLWQASLVVGPAERETVSAASCKREATTAKSLFLEAQSAVI